MSQQKKLEQVLDLLLSEDQEQAAEILHQIIVEKARTIYESLVDEETVDVEDEGNEELDEADNVGGNPEEDFTAEISSDEEEIESDEHNDGEVDDDGAVEDENDEGEEEELDDRVDDLEAQLEELRAEFDALMGEELQEPNHADLADNYADETGDEIDAAEADIESDSMFEKKGAAKLEKAPRAKTAKNDKKVAEETQFLSKVADTGQKGTAKLAGTGNKSAHGAEGTQSPYTHAPSKKDFGGKPVKFGSGTGGEYGKYHGDSATDDTITDNVDVEPKKVSDKADSTPKYTGGKTAGDGGSKSPLTKKPA